VRKTMFLIGSLALLLLLALAFWPDASMKTSQAIAQEKPPQPADKSIEANNAATKHRLATRLEADFTEMPLSSALEYVADNLEIEIYAQGQDLEGVGVSLESTVTLKLKRVRGDMLLDLLLRQVSPEIGYVVRDGIVVIAPKDSLAEHLAIRVYNCRDLLAMATTVHEGAPAAADPSAPGLGAAFPGGLPGTGGLPEAEAGGLPPGGGLDAWGGVPIMRSPQVEQLLRLLHTTVAPNTWDVNGGPGTMEEFGGLLVVNQTEEVHDRIEKLLQIVRDAAEKKPMAK
jgi:hypothetical protein